MDEYPLATDYIEEREWLIEGVREVAKYAQSKGVWIALEYKMKEPRTHSYLAWACDTLLVVQATGLDNVGITIDTGHAFLAHENVGEVVALLTQRRLCVPPFQTQGVGLLRQAIESPALTLALSRRKRKPLLACPTGGPAFRPRGKKLELLLAGHQ